MDQPNTNFIGESIRTFRKKLGLSQLEFENKLNLANGSLTKIEAGKTIPHRETLLKIIDTFDINTFESLTLLGLPVNKIIDVINLINDISILEDEFEVTQKAANGIPSVLGLLGSSVCITAGEYLTTGAITQSWYTNILLSILPFPLVDFRISLTKDINNLMVRSLSEDREIYGNDLNEFTTPFINPKIANLLQRTANVKSILCVPMITKEQKIGTILYVKNVEMTFEEEIPLLKAFTNSVAIAIYNLRKREKGI